MAQTYLSSPVSSVGTSNVNLLTVPVATTGLIIGLCLSNTTSATILATVTLTRGATSYSLCTNAQIPAGSSILPIGGDQKVVLMASDVLKVKSSVASSMDAILSYVQIQ